MNIKRKQFQDNLRKNINSNNKVSNDDEILSDEELKIFKDRLQDYKALKSD